MENVTVQMKSLIRSAPLIAAALLSAGALTACSHPNEHYNRGYNENRRWDRREELAYERWEMDRQLRHIEFARREAAEQRAYWIWRHDHPDRR
jgi:hypothetical protein